MTLHTIERDEAYVAYADSLPVYFAFSEALQLVKVGFSSNVRQRIGTLTSDRREAGRLALIGWAIGGPQLEFEIHERFAESRERGEWFHPVPEMADFIDEEGEEGEPPTFANGPFRVSTRGYWSARKRLTSVSTVERVVHTFADGRSFRSRDLVSDVAVPVSRFFPEPASERVAS